MKVDQSHVRVLHEPRTTSAPDMPQIPSPFSGTWTDTLWILRREVGALGGREVVLVVDALPGNMRRDGGLRADAKVRSDYVEVYLPATDRGPIRFACGKFYGARWGARSLAGWQANVRAVALGMEALRKVRRYGIADDDQQYRGWQALPPGDPIALGAAKMTTEEAARLLVDLGEVDGCTEPADPGDLLLPGHVQREVVTGYYRRAAHRHHPDAGGDPDVFRRITEARDLLLTG